jgi:hypothetical protein
MDERRGERLLETRKHDAMQRITTSRVMIFIATSHTSYMMSHIVIYLNESWIHFTL